VWFRGAVVVAVVRLVWGILGGWRRRFMGCRGGAGWRVDGFVESGVGFGVLWVGGVGRWGWGACDLFGVV